jgi:hypothetical protein
LGCELATVASCLTSSAGPGEGLGGFVSSTVATRLIHDHRHDLVLVADILGHADVKTIRHYARSGLEDRRAALEDLAD